MPHESVVNIVSNENYAVEIMLITLHVTLDFTACIDQATQNNCVDYIYTVSTPAFVQVVE
jgi:hypothetical protein